MKRLDWYIIKKFLGTFFFSIVLILSIAIVFDLTEKMDDFFEHQVPLREIILDYYLPFIPYYMNMFSSLFIFISVIYFTSKMAGNSEIIAIQAAGMSYHRLMVPYAISATLLFVLSIFLGGWVIPRSSERMINFTDKYVEHFSSENARHIQMEVEPGTVLYIESFQRRSAIGYRMIPCPTGIWITTQSGRLRVCTRPWSKARGKISRFLLFPTSSSSQRSRRNR